MSEHPELSWTCECGDDLMLVDGSESGWLCPSCHAHWVHETSLADLGKPGTYRYNLVPVESMESGPQ